jgi:tetratricopeptide (TPR) repeat protein
MNAIRLRALVAAAALGLGAALPAAAADEPLKETALKLNDLKDSDAMQARLTELLKDKGAAKKLVQAAAKMEKEAKGEKPFKYNAALVLAKLGHSVKDYDDAELFYEHAADLATKAKDGEDMLRAYEGLMDLFWDQKKYDTVEEVARKMLDLKGGKTLEDSKPFVLEKLVQAKAKQGDTDEALRMAEGLVQLDKDGWYFLQLKGWVQREAGKTDDAIATYEDVLDKLDDAKGMKPDVKSRIKRNVRYVLSGLHVDNKAIDKAAKQLQILIKDDPDNPTYYNDLGFIWCDNDKNLDESEKLIRKALELDTKQRKKLLEEKKIDEDDVKKENAAYVDSLGWVLFKQKKYAEAAKLLEQAAHDEDEGQHIEIWDHWADTLVALGKKKEAVDVWQKALKFEDISPRDKERRKKVTQKMNKVKEELGK